MEKELGVAKELAVAAGGMLMEFYEQSVSVDWKAPGDPVTLGQLLEGSGAASGELLKPRAPARNRLDQGRITCRAVRLLR